jgi:predicted PurR-regulated permease PerM
VSTTDDDHEEHGEDGEASAEAHLARAEAGEAQATADEALAEATGPHSTGGNEFGRLGHPLKRDSPFMLGFLGALGVFLAYFLTQAIVQARSVIVLIVVSLFLAIGLNPLVEWLTARNIRRGGAIAIVFLIVIGAFVGFGFAVIPPVVEQSDAFIDELPAYLHDLRGNPTIRGFDNEYGVIERAQDYVSSGDLGQRAFGGIVGVGQVVLNAVFSTLSVLIMTLYFLTALPSMKRQTYRLVPATRRERVQLLSDEVLSRIGGYVSGALSVAFIAGLSTYIFLMILGMPYALALAVFVAMLDLIPLVGATLAAIVVSLIGFTESVAVGIACIIFYVAYQQFENYLVYPRVMRRAVDVPAPMTVVAVLLGGALLGVVGALLAIPIAAAFLLIVRQVAIPRMDRL